MGAELIRLSSFRFNKANTSNYTFTASIYDASNTTQLWTQSYTTSSSCNPTCSVTVTNPPILLAGTTYVVRFSGSLGTTWIDNQGLYFQKSQLKANNDSLTLNFGATTGNTLNILANDTDESGAANVGTTAGTVRLFTSGTSKDGTNTPLGCTPATCPSSLTVNSTGTITVGSTTPAGVYTWAYEICNAPAPSPPTQEVCDVATATITVNAVVVAQDDTMSGASAGSSTTSVLANNGNGIDTVNGAQAVIGSNVTLSNQTGGTFPSGGSALSVNTTTGQIDIPANAVPGTYTVPYRICSTVQPSACDTAVATVVVNAELTAVDDGSATVPMSTIKAGGGLASGTTTLSVFNNDSINGVVPTSATVTVTVTGSSPLTIDADGKITAPAGTTPGLYPVPYQICSTAQPSVCASATAYIKVLPDDATLSSLRDFRAELDSGRILIRWETEGEVGTAGFYVERQDPVTGDYRPVHEDILPALLDAPQGGSYRLLDATAAPDQSHTYRLIEREVWGSTRQYGPWTVTPALSPRQANADPGLDGDTLGYADPAQGYQAQPRLVTPRPRDRNAQALSALAAPPSTPGVIQIPVRKDGLISISTAQLAPALGYSTSQIQTWLRTGQLELTNAGRAIAWKATPGAVALLFYGQGIDSLYTQDNVYRLRANQPGLRMSATAATPKAPPAAAASLYSDTLPAEEDLFAGTVIATDPQADYWYWHAFAGGNLASGSSKVITVQVPDVAGGGTLRIYVKGTAVGVHTAQVQLNGQLLGQGTWNDLNDGLLAYPVTAQQLLSGSNTIEITALGDRTNLFYLDRIAIDYQRRARAVNDQLTVTAAQPGPLGIEGFSHAAIQVFDLTDPAKPIAVSQLTITPTANGHSVTFNAQTGRRYHASASAASATLNAQTAALPEQDQVNYLVLTAPALRSAAQTLADYRQSRGQPSRVVTTQEIYDSRNGGIANPHAVQQFLTHAINRWGVRHIVLVGVGSFDYRDLKGSGEPQVPTLLTATPNGLYGCDNCLADSNNDGVPDVPMGRIPAASAAEVQAYLSKLQRHEQSTATLRQTGALFIADKTDPAAGRFAQDSDQLTQTLPSDLSLRKLYLDTTPLATARTQLISAFNSGVGWVNYIGHGGAYGLSKSNLLTINDLGLLQSSSPHPIVSAMSCAVNRFELPGYIALGERLVLDSDGGAIAIWSATGLSMNQAAVPLNQSLLEALFQQRSPTLGEAIQQALANHANRPDMPAYMPRIYSLLGDPALTLRP